MEESLAVNNDTPPQNSTVFASPSAADRLKKAREDSFKRKSNSTSTPPSAIPSPGGSSTRLYENAKIRQARMEEKRKEAPPGCTFAPTTRKTRLSAKVGTPSGVSRFDALYENAKLTQEKRDQIRLTSGEEGCTFRPKTNAHRRSKTAGVSGNSSLASSTPRFEALYQNAADRAGRLEEEAKQREVEGCTFTPTINRHGRVAKSRSVGSFEQRLYDTDATARRAAALEEKKAALEMKDCTFKPKLRRHQSAPRARPRGVDGASESGTGTGAPSIFERLARAGRDSEAKKEKLREAKLEESLAEATFKPRLSHSKSVRVPTSTVEVHDRLHQLSHNNAKEAKLEARRKELERDYTFKPKLNKRSQSAGRLRMRRSLEGSGGGEGDAASVSSRTSQSVFERLHSESVDHMEMMRLWEEAKAAKELEECTFKPQTHATPRSSGGGGSSSASSSSEVQVPVWERLNEDRASVVLLREEIKLQKELEECTFAPQIKKEGGGGGSVSGPEGEGGGGSSTGPGVFERLSREAKDVNVREKLKEHRELEDCTFSPKITLKAKRLSAQGAAQGQGDIFRRLSLEAEQRAQKARVLEEEKLRREVEGCTFQPQLIPNPAAEGAVEGSEGGGGEGGTGEDGRGGLPLPRKESFGDRMSRLAAPQTVSNKREINAARWERDQRIAKEHARAMSDTASNASVGSVASTGRRSRSPRVSRVATAAADRRSRSRSPQSTSPRSPAPDRAASPRSPRSTEPKLLRGKKKGGEAMAATAAAAGGGAANGATGAPVDVLPPPPPTTPAAVAIPETAAAAPATVLAVASPVEANGGGTASLLPPAPPAAAPPSFTLEKFNDFQAEIQAKMNNLDA